MEKPELPSDRWILDNALIMHTQYVYNDASAYIKRVQRISTTKYTVYVNFLLWQVLKTFC